MPSAPFFPDDEAARLARLRELAVLDSDPEPIFDSLTDIAAGLCGVPIALVSLVDAQRQWFKSCIGLGLRETGRNVAFCAHAILDDGLMEVPDTRLDPRFADNPLVTGDPHIRFYAGAPIAMPGGQRIGTLCVIDRVPRRLDDTQKALLTRLAAAAAQALLVRERALADASQWRSRLETEIAALKGATQALGASERRFRELSEASPVGVFHTDAAGHCTYTNSRWQEIYGLSLEHSLGNGWTESVHADDRASVFEQWRRAAQAEDEFSMQFRVRRADGSVRQVRSRSRPVRSDNGELSGYVGAVADITEATQMQQKLHESEALVDRAGQIAGVGGWSLDLATQQLTWTDQTCRIHDLPPGHAPALGEAIHFYAPQAQPVIEQAVRAAIDKGTPWDLELPLVTATGRAIWVRALGEAEFEGDRPVRIFGAFQDITARRHADERLQQKRQLLRVLYESSPAMLQSIDPQGCVLTVTDHWLVAFGYSRDAVVGQPAATLFAPPWDERWTQTMQPVLFAQGAMEREPAQMRCTDGSVRDVLLSAVLDRDNAGQPRRALLFIEDVTEHLARRAELQREQVLRHQIERHAQDLRELLAERSEMLDVLAHEVRQPLNNASAALRSASAVLAGKGEALATARLERARTVLGEVLAGVDNTLAAASLLAGASGLQHQELDVDTLIDVVIADLAPGDRPRVQVHHQAALHGAPMDLGLMRLALRNLLSNALKYSPPGSPVLLRAVDVEDAGAAGPALALEVIDSGPGFDLAPDQLPFERGSKGKRGGSGLGLYIARRVMELHAGRIELVSSSAQGSTLRLVLAPPA
jgi:PAS domain S-box-containing protein